MLNLNWYHYCEVCNSWLEFCFDRCLISFEGINIHLSNIPLLRCDNCARYYFPEKTKSAIVTVTEQAKAQAKPVVRLSPQQGFKRYFNYGKVKFLYDHRDYENIPGLHRPWDDGFLTPVFFNLAVLNKYSQHPDYRLDLFSRTYGSISKNDEFDISFGINRNRKVIMWLGDIDKLPLSEQYYLISENIESCHDLCSEFYESQIEAQFSNPSPENALFHARTEAIQICQRVRGGYLHTFEGEISKVIENLDRPVFWQEKHINPVIEALNRVMVESLDPKFLKNELKNIISKDEYNDLQGFKSLKLFERWLGKALHISNFSSVSLPFYVLYDFRVLSSHLTPGSKRKDTLRGINQRLDLTVDNENYEVIYDALINKLRESYETILTQLQKQRNEEKTSL